MHFIGNDDVACRWADARHAAFRIAKHVPCRDILRPGGFAEYFHSCIALRSGHTRGYSVRNRVTQSIEIDQRMRKWALPNRHGSQNDNSFDVQSLELIDRFPEFLEILCALPPCMQQHDLGTI